MSELLIPFGIHRETGEFIEPEDADRGRACNCICPGCKAPLLSRHPQDEDRRRYFAHDSKHELAKPEEECPFSSSVAVAMMVRELAQQYIGKIFQTPPLDVGGHCESCHDKWPIAVTEGAEVVIDDVEVNSSEQSHRFDLKLIVKGYALYIDLIYKGKPPEHLEESELIAVKAGVLALSCDSFSLARFKSARKLRFSDAVLVFVLKEGLRQWRFHPRQKSMIEASQRNHRCQPLYVPPKTPPCWGRYSQPEKISRAEYENPTKGKKG